MTRQIICAHGCKEHLQKLWGSTDDSNRTRYDDEFCSFMPGTALYDFACDQCGRDIRAGSACYALSLWSTTIPRYIWEQDFIKPDLQTQG